MADEALRDLLSKPVPYRGDLYRNIKTCRESQHLFDDLTDDPADYDIANHIEAITGTPAGSPVIEYPFNNLAVTRFSDGTFGVFYGSMELATTINETIYHWLRFLNDAGFLNREIIGERRVYLVHADAILFDCTDKTGDYPGLIHPRDYSFTHDVGAHIRAQDRDGLITRSARCDGINAPIFRPDRLSNTRVNCHLTYTVSPNQRIVRVERQRRRTLMEVTWNEYDLD